MNVERPIEIQSQTDANQAARVESYYYDPTDQLTGVSYASGRSVSYSFDPVGNRLNVNDSGTQTAYVPNILNQYNSIGGAPVTHDASGNLSGHAGWTYGYDSQNRLVSAQSATSAVQMQYDARNRCVSRTVNGVATFFYYDEWDLIEERDSTGNLIAKYTHGARVDEVLAMSNSGGTYYLHQDALGSTTHLTDTSGAVLEKYSYDAFGTPTILGPNNESRVTSFVGNRFMFTGREWLAQLGLYDYRNRVYSPVMGRFLQLDPLRFGAGDINLFRYVSNHAVGSTDPFGLQEFLLTPPPPSAYESMEAWNEWRNYNQAEATGALYGSAIGLGAFGGAALLEAGGLAAAGKVCLYTAAARASTQLSQVGQRVGNFVGSKGPLFGRKGSGILNSNKYLRVGWGWKGSKTSGREVFRIAWGERGSPWHGHLDIWPPF